MGLGGMARGEARDQRSIAAVSDTGKSTSLCERRNRMPTAETRALERRGRVGQPKGRLELEPRQHRPDEAGLEEITSPRRVDGPDHTAADAEHATTCRVQRAPRAQRTARDR